VNCVSVAHLIDLVARQLIAVPAELGGCIVLAAADQVVTKPLDVGPANLLLFEDGVLRVSGADDSDQLTIEGTLRKLLGTLLSGATSATPALLRAARRTAAGDLRSFVNELEIALVPTNRGAAKRALARLCREAKRATVSLPEQPGELVEPPVLPVSQSRATGAPEPPLPEPVPDIPDLELPSSGAHDSLAPQFDGSSGRQPPGNQLESELLELSDADVVDLVESEEGLPVEAATVVIGPESEMVCSPERDHQRNSPIDSVVDPTSPFPLVRVIRPAMAPETTGVPIPPRPVASKLRAPRLRKPLFAAPPVTLAAAVLQVEPGEVDSALSVEGPTGVARQGVRAEQGRAGSSKIPPQRSECEPAERQPVVGPHRFIARACFAKKTSKVIERVSRFGQASTGEPEQLVDGLQNLASGNNGG
jgi:hypothetical protein